MFLTIILFLLQAVTPHVNPSATPYPDTELVPFPWWGWILIVIFVPAGIVGVYKIWKSAHAVPGKGYIHYRDDGSAQVPKDTEPK